VSYANKDSLKRFVCKMISNLRPDVENSCGSVEDIQEAIDLGSEEPTNKHAIITPRTRNSFTQQFTLYRRRKLCSRHSALPNLPSITGPSRSLRRTWMSRHGYNNGERFMRTLGGSTFQTSKTEGLYLFSKNPGNGPVGHTLF
jgi:hypothetical protein